MFALKNIKNQVLCDYKSKHCCSLFPLGILILFNFVWNYNACKVYWLSPTHYSYFYVSVIKWNKQHKISKNLSFGRLSTHKDISNNTIQEIKNTNNMSRSKSALASKIIKEHFGDIVEKISSFLVQSGRKTLGEIFRGLPLTKEEARLLFIIS